MRADYEFSAAEANSLAWQGEDYELAFASSANVFSEAEAEALATELLEISSEAELDQFLGKLIKKAWRGVKGIAKGVLRPLGKVLKTVAKKALPFLAGAAGSLLGPAGTALGTAAGAALSKALEVELEGLEPEEQEFEAARRFVQLAGAAAQRAAQAPPGADPQAALRQAFRGAMRQQFPLPKRAQGRWKRKGKLLILYGA